MAIKPSPHLALLLLLTHVMVAAVVYATMMPLETRLVLLMLSLLSLLYYLARDALLLLPASWCEILVDRDRVTVSTRGGGSGFSGEVANGTVVNPYFVVLRVRPEGHRLPVFRTIFPDALGTDEFRELCVRLRFAQ